MVSPQRFFLSLLSFFCLSSFFSFLIIHLARRGSVTRKTASEIDNYEWWNCSTKAHCSSSRGRRRSWKGVWATRNGRHRYGRDAHDGHGEIGLLEESWKGPPLHVIFTFFTVNIKATIIMIVISLASSVGSRMKIINFVCIIIIVLTIIVTWHPRAGMSLGSAFLE